MKKHEAEFRIIMLAAAIISLIACGYAFVFTWYHSSFLAASFYLLFPAFFFAQVLKPLR